MALIAEQHAPTSAARRSGICSGKPDGIEVNLPEPLLEEHLAMAGFDVRVYDLPAT
jgi:hypothetical protein